MFDTKNWIFPRKPIITVKNFYPFISRGDGIFHEEKKTSILFLYRYDIHLNTQVQHISKPFLLNKISQKSFKIQYRNTINYALANLPNSVYNQNRIYRQLKIIKAK